MSLSHMIGPNLMETLAWKAGATVEMIGDYAVFYRDCREIGRTLLTSRTFAARHAVERILSTATEN